MYTIKFNFEQQGIAAVCLVNIEAGQNLLEIALTHGIELHHNCGGVCACSTCHLYVLKGEEHLEAISRREKDFIARAVRPQVQSRLGCQCLLLDGSGVIEVCLPDQTQLRGK